MIIHHGFSNLKIRMPVVTIGIFDGVHRGHIFLIDTLLRKAKETSGESVVITFEPHPRLVLDDNPSALSFLSTPEEKISLLRKAGIDNLIIARFTREFSQMKACDFVNEELLKKMGTKILIIGHDHHFGFRGEGNIESIRECAENNGIKVVHVSGLQKEGATISSSAIRSALLAGKPELANDFLGYTYSIKGVVVEGRKLGRSLGFPTANIYPADIHKLVPADGVYAVEISVCGKSEKGMLSIGTNPTVSDGKLRSIEVNIFDFDRDIYGEEAELFFRFRIRDEKKFDSMKELASKMSDDREKALLLLS